MSSVWASTLIVIADASCGLRCLSSRRSSLMTSAPMTGMTAIESRLEPTSSSATPQPEALARSTTASSPAGSVARARSLTSTKTRSIDSARVTTARRSGGHATANASGSTLRNSDSDGGSPAPTNASNAAARHTQSSSATRPARRAAANSAAGSASAVPRGPRASASSPTTSRDCRSTTGWKTTPMSRRARTPSSSRTSPTSCCDDPPAEPLSTWSAALIRCSSGVCTVRPHPRASTATRRRTDPSWAPALATGTLRRTPDRRVIGCPPAPRSSRAPQGSDSPAARHARSWWRCSPGQPASPARCPRRRSPQAPQAPQAW
ncbi:hypothetical protein GALL_483740 [mine drainage metagenome]|uniref:Uncharacterized protein n=1 Tax=mine drainage metagenome TaxID=410659 RepID=A0A1J5PXH8_9ZZZZ